MLYPDESYRIMGACFAVYNDKGCGFLEDVYQECLEIEFEHLGIPFVSRPEQELTYRGRRLRQTYKPDFICYGKIIIELKVVGQFADRHRAQLLNYLNASGHLLGILVNFASHPKLEYERIALSRKRGIPEPPPEAD